MKPQYLPSVCQTHVAHYEGKIKIDKQGNKFTTQRGTLRIQSQTKGSRDKKKQKLKGLEGVRR